MQTFRDTNQSFIGHVNKKNNWKEILVYTDLCPETSAHKIQMFGNHPKESIQLSENGGCLKSRRRLVCMKDAKSVFRDMACVSVCSPHKMLFGRSNQNE